MSFETKLHKLSGFSFFTQDKKSLLDLSPIVLNNILHIISSAFGVVEFINFTILDILELLLYEFNELEEKKKASDARIKYWETHFAALQAKSDSLKAEIDALERKTKVAEAEAKKSKARFEELSKELAKTRHNIEEFKKNPPNRTGDLLLESLKNKTK